MHQYTCFQQEIVKPCRRGDHKQPAGGVAHILKPMRYVAGRVDKRTRWGIDDGAADVKLENAVYDVEGFVFPVMYVQGRATLWRYLKEKRGIGSVGIAAPSK